MSTGTVVLANLGSDEFSVKMYGSLSSASRVILNVKSQTQALFLSAHFWKLNRLIGDLLDDVQGIAEGRAKPEPTDEPYSPERADSVISSLDELGRMLSYLYEQSRRRQLTNNSLVAGSLARLKDYSERLRDVSDWLHVIVQPEEVGAIFKRAEEEKERGEIFDISSVR